MDVDAHDFGDAMGVVAGEFDGQVAELETGHVNPCSAAAGCRVLVIWTTPAGGIYQMIRLVTCQTCTPPISWTPPPRRRSRCPSRTKCRHAMQLGVPERAKARNLAAFWVEIAEDDPHTV